MSTHEIVPDGVDLAELQRRRDARPNRTDACKRCPHCGYAKLSVRIGRFEHNDGRYYCGQCERHTDEPAVADSIEAAREGAQ